MNLLENDYLGGSGTRGYGRIHFKDLQVNAISNDIKNLDAYKQVLKEVK
jgi:CRISPR-associated protein Csm3